MRSWKKSKQTWWLIFCSFGSYLPNTKRRKYKMNGTKANSFGKFQLNSTQAFGRYFSLIFGGHEDKTMLFEFFRTLNSLFEFSHNNPFLSPWNSCGSFFIDLHSNQQQSTKGQLISKCPFGVIVSTKVPTNFFKDFCPSLWKEVKSKQ